MNPSDPASPLKLRVWLLAVVSLVIFVSSYYVRLAINNPLEKKAVPASDYQRIVAISPSSVEIIYQLGLEEKLVGVSRFCNYPPEARQKHIVGGYIDLDFEAVLALEPDCVVLLEEQAPLVEKLNYLGIHTILLDHASTHGIVSSITTLGNTFHKTEQAEALVKSINTRINAATKKHSNGEKAPRVLVCIDRDTSASHPDRVTAAGSQGVHQEYISMVGGINVCHGPVPFPRLSREHLIQLNPDIIIDLVREDVWQKLGRDNLLQQWAAYEELSAVKNSRVIILHQNKHLIPGPRFVDTLESFANAINPDQPTM